MARMGSVNAPEFSRSESVRRSRCAERAVLSWHEAAALAAPRPWEPRCPMLEVIGQSFRAGGPLFYGAC